MGFHKQSGQSIANSGINDEYLGKPLKHSKVIGNLPTCLAAPDSNPVSAAVVRDSEQNLFFDFF